MNKRTVKDRFLIVCEGAKTEPNYFNAFKVKTADIQVVGLGANTISLVDKTLTLMNKDDYDQVWCVFDKDSFTSNDFNTAITKARANGIQVAYSNEAFELWYILHFQYLDTGIDRKTYIEKLTQLLGRYRKNNPNMYELLFEKQNDAISRAKKLYNSYSNHNKPAANKPSTTIHLLVEQLNRFI